MKHKINTVIPFDAPPVLTIDESEFLAEDVGILEVPISNGWLPDIRDNSELSPGQFQFTDELGNAVTGTYEVRPQPPEGIAA